MVLISGSLLFGMFILIRKLLVDLVSKVIVVVWIFFMWFCIG